MKSSKLCDPIESIFPIYSPTKFAVLLGIPLKGLKKIADKAQDYYDPFTDKNERFIDNPRGILKEIQSRIHKRILRQYEYPSYLIGGIKGRSALGHLVKHTGKPVVLTADIEKCFPSITNRKVFEAWRYRLGCSPVVAHLATKLVTRDGHVPLGASTSTLITYLVLIPSLDRINAILKKEGMGELTQWIDDMALSGSGFSNDLISKIAKKFAKEGLKIHRTKDKLRIMRSSSPQHIIKKNVNKKVSIPSFKRNRVRAALEEIKRSNPGTPDYEKKCLSVKGRIHEIRGLHPAEGTAMLEEYNSAVRLPRKATFVRGVKQ